MNSKKRKGVCHDFFENAYIKDTKKTIYRPSEQLHKCTWLYQCLQLLICNNVFCVYTKATPLTVHYIFYHTVHTFCELMSHETKASTAESCVKGQQ